MVLARTERLTPEELPRWESLSPAVQSDLYRIGTHSTAELWSLLRLMPEDVDALIGSGAVENSDDNLFVELRTPWLLYADHFSRAGEGPSAQAWQRIDAVPISRQSLLEPALDLPGAPRAGELALAYLNVRHDVATTARIAPLGGDSGEVIASRAQFARSAGKLDDDGFLAQLDRALELEPRSFDVRMLRAHQRILRGDSAGALADLDVADSLRPSDPVQAGVRASALLRLNRAGKARAELAAIEHTEYWAQSPPLWYLAGLAAVQAGELADAAARLERYTQSEPGFVQAWQTLEQVYTQMGRTEDAARARRNRAMNLYLLAMRAERAGDVARAKETLQRALAIAPEHERAKAALARLGG
jgi:Tfp pilus assembly protein PilF